MGIEDGKYYIVDAQTQIFTGRSGKASLDPMEHKKGITRWLLPSDAYLTKPPDTKEKEIARVSKVVDTFMKTCTWEIVNDNRGLYFNKQTKEPYFFNEIGSVPDLSIFTNKAPEKNQVWDKEKDSWVEDAGLWSEEHYKALSVLREKALNGGFTYKGHTYATEEKYRTNIICAYLMAQMFEQEGNGNNPIEWSDINGQEVIMTNKDFIELFVAVCKYFNDLFVLKRNMCKELEKMCDINSPDYDLDRVVTFNAEKEWSESISKLKKEKTK